MNSNVKTQGVDLPFYYYCPIVISFIYVIHILFNDITCYKEKIPYLVYLKLLYCLNEIGQCILVCSILNNPLLDFEKIIPGFEMIKYFVKGFFIFAFGLETLLLFISFIVELGYIKALKKQEDVEKTVNSTDIGTLVQTNQMYSPPQQV